MPRTLATLAAGLVLLAGCGTDDGGNAEGEEGAETSAPPAGPYAPNEDDQDPSERIEGVETVDYPGGMHADPGQRVAYDRHPPLGGAHDEVWASCNGVVYDRAVRTEHMVHALEHGAVWIAYDPEVLDEAEVTALAERVDGQPYLLMSPYPEMDTPVSLQSWGHQLKLERADDERVDQFIQALRANPYTTPEPGAPCDIDPRAFDPTDPPPFDPSEPGPDAMPVTGD
ncbi:DUF3105 domain-containing protein [Actinophytocola gossypii]|uniref:DUF3105 domain-containing protein n=1 Tax=Actinophytocola gossypii TaxID=2812003 RepID=A0ABT2JC96_9PSEU|nr:DUF3105 domain-containing protein [Actinophytocola gossypii]MCT2585085.1 DUF3105 domain-containing protein [Actinophytocola gossypii]